MVPWRCEYTYLLLAWPIACILWLLLAVMLLSFMKESIDIYNPADLSMKYSILGLMALPYTVTPDYTPEGPQDATYPNNAGDEEMETITPSDPRATSTAYDPSSSYSMPQPYEESLSSRRPMIKTMQRSDTISVPRGANCVTIRITMPSSFGWRSWRWYEAVIETTAVGVYLYATFVLTSLVFLNADKAIAYATVMALCLSMVRILTVLF
ncbi:MAG: hypothetical protein Q9166_002623 [cf. Caloplaca sp. 2 TL-2023]